MSTLKHIRSSVANKRPAASGLADGQLGINTASGTPGLYFKDTASGIVKVGPAHVGSTAPNASPAGSAGNAIGEFWVDNSLTTQGLKYYTGATFYNLTPSGTTSAPGLVELATSAETQTGTDPDRAVTPSALQSKLSDSTNTTSSTTIASSTAVKSAYDLANAALPKSGGTVTGEIVIGTSGALSFEGSVDDGFETTLAVVNPTADRTITLPNTTGTVITTGDTGSVTSTMIADGTIVDGDINASASIALSKLATGALPSAITVNSSNIVDGSIVNADVSASAAIAGSKISPDFGNQTIQTTGIVSHATGSAGAPTITFTGDTNTGVYSPGTDQVAISTNGVGRLFIDSSGGVGIGTITPSALLHVAGQARIGANDSSDAVLEIGAGATGNRNAHIDLVGDTTYTDYGLRLIRNNGGANATSTLAHRGTGTLYINCQENADLAFSTNNTLRAFFSNTTFKLVGTDITSNSNAGNITIFGGDGTGANIELFGGSHASYANLMVLDAGEHRIRSQDGTSERVRIDSSGKVGIGASAPLEFVDIRRPNGAGDLAVRLVHEGQVEYKIGIKDSDDKLYITNNNGNTALGATTGIIITSAGNVGINTASPGAALDVQGNIRLSASTPNIEFNNGGAMVYGPSANTLAFATGGGVSSPVEKARIDSSGRLLVGTSSRRRVGTPFDPIGGVFYEGSTFSSYEAFTAVVNRTDHIGAVLSFGKSGGNTNGSNTIVANGDQLGVIRFSGADGTDLESIAAEIKVEVDGTPGSNDMPGRLVFSTTVDGFSSPEERMRITGGGSIRIGQSTTDTPGFGNTTTGIGMEPANGALFLSRPDGGCSLFINSNFSTGTADAMNFRRSNVFVGSVTTTTTSTAYNTSSDYRLKENVTAVTDGIARLQQLKPSRFNFIADPTKTVDGFLAHEVQSVIPEAITGEKDAVNDDGNPVYQGIDQSKLVPLVVAALQEAIAKIESLEARLTAAGI